MSPFAEARPPLHSPGPLPSIAPDLAGALMTILRHKAVRGLDLGHALRWGAAQAGVSTLRMGFDILRRQLGRQKLTGVDYFTYGLHDRRMPREARRDFLGDGPVTALNSAVAGTVQESLAGFFRDKLMTEVLLTRAGLPSARTRAAFARGGATGFVPVLPDAEALAAALLDPAALPVFGKPHFGSRSVGTLGVDAAAGEGRVRLSDGREVSASDLAAEIAAAWPEGYLLQDRVVPHPDYARLTGPTLGVLRVVTLMEAKGPGVLYAVARFPAAGAMADDIGAGLGMAVHLDPASGRVLRAQEGNRLGGRAAEVTPVTGVPLAGMVVPMVPEGVALALRVQRLFAVHRILGVDIGLSDKGPVVVEVNGNPLHGLYQRAAGRGVLNPDFAPRLAALLPPRHPLRRRYRQLA